MIHSEALQFINSFANYERTASWTYPDDVKLDRMQALAKALGNPQNRYETIIIAGSKGKGSTAAFLSSILRMENLRVGLYTSPHLVDVRERIQVNGLWIGETRFVEIALRLRNILDDASWRKNPPTYFEILTAMAFCHFEQMKVQVAVLEVGLGGIYDSTNIAPAKVVGLTPISLEHTDKLGKTIAKIAVQKCGVVKGRESVVASPQADEAESVIRKTVEAKEASVTWVGRDIKIFEREFSDHSQTFDLKAPFGNFFGLETALLGRHQLDNAAVAVGLAKALEKKTRLKISDSAIRQGIRDAAWPGRLDQISNRPSVVLDGAQNPASARTALLGIKRHFHFEKMVLVLGVSQDKDLEGILAELLPSASAVVVTESQNPRATPAVVVAEAARQSGKEVMIEKTPRAALEKAKSLAGPEDIILVTGSLFLLGELVNGR